MAGNRGRDLIHRTERSRDRFSQFWQSVAFFAATRFNDLSGLMEADAQGPEFCIKLVACLRLTGEGDMLRLALSLSFVVCVVSGLPAGSASAENWPGWRGPRGDGSSRDQSVPLVWNGETGENVLWKVELPGEGHSSPVVWNDRLFVTGCVLESKQRILSCRDANDGRILWTKVVLESPLETKHVLNSYASSTPVTDGQFVYVSFLETDGSTVPAPNVGTPRPVTPGTMVIAAYDFDGKRRWIARPGSFVSAHGYCSNPVLFENLVIVNGDHDGDSYIVALDRNTGEIVWKTERKYKTRSYVTPLIREIAGEPQMVFSGSKRVVSMDPRTGELLWTVEGPTEQFVASMVYDGRLFYLAAGYPTYHVMAIRPDGEGDVTESHVAWHVTNVKCYVPSPVVVGDYLLVADDRGTANCFDTATGERLWLGRLGRHFSSSLVSVQGVVLFVADDGNTSVVEPGAELKVLHENPLGEWCYSSPAIADGRLYLRGETHLFCIGEPGPSAE